MNLLTKVREEFYFNTYKIDRLISNYLIKRLGVNDIETINALGLKGRMTFETRLDLLMQIKSVSRIDKKKLEIYSKLYQSITLQKDYPLNNRNDYFQFLVENYPQEEGLSGNKKVGKILIDFVLDVRQIIEKISRIPTLKIIDDSVNVVEDEIQLTAI